MINCNYGYVPVKYKTNQKGDVKIMVGFVVVAILAVIIFIVLKTKKKQAQQSAAAGKANAEEKAAKEKAAAEEKAAAVEAFWSVNNVDEALDNIFPVLEKSSATVTNFEKGFDHFFSKVETTLKKEDVFPVMKKALFVRAFAGDNCAVAKAVAVGYFIQDVVNGQMFSLYMRFATVREKGYDLLDWVEPFIQALYGVAGHAFNHQYYRLQPESYEVMTPDAFKVIIENNDTLKSYTDRDPFTADSVRETWAKLLCESPVNVVRSSELGDILDNEKYIDELCYLAYTVLRKDEENISEKVSVSEIAVAYLEYLKEKYNRISH